MPNIVKNTTFPNLFDLLAPHSCRGCRRTGSVLCDCCKNNIIKVHSSICPKCKAKNRTANCPKCSTLPPVHVIGERSGVLEQLIYDLKYRSVRSTAKSLAEIIDAILPELKGNIVIVPLPTIAKHIRTRGLDHTYLIAKHLAKIRGQNYQVKPLLLRSHNTIQVGTDRKTRLSQAEKAYEINPKIKIDSQSTYLLLDDVWTTGASMQAALKKLSSTNIKHIELIILALSEINQE